MRIDKTARLEEPPYLEIELAVGAVADAASQYDRAEERLHQDGGAHIIR